ncbi:MAG: Re/Si-specific NAD(P)(+) transhydrogenase subunit alpha [Saprospiraceae bacterium]|nr:Re/Si-specific NAD(P)(+) transhydrogenase subunit alpha [Saprospiraceae bacterium]
MILGILKEDSADNRVAVIPETAAALLKLGVKEVHIEAGAGERAGYRDADYTAQGAQVTSESEVLSKAELIVKINPPTSSQTSQLKAGQMILGQYNPLTNRDVTTPLLASNVTAFSLDMLPRTTRAQASDVLSSMATVAGYKAVLLAANEFVGFFPMFMTAAGTIKPAKVLILGAGVAGLQAIATAKRLGAVVEAFDVRTAAKEEVLSLGAKFVDVEGAQESAAAGGYAIEQSDEFKQRQAEAVHKHGSMADVVICTAQIPGRQAPVLLRKATVEAMKPGSVVIDLAASSGGNCEVTENGKTIVHNGVKIIGNSSLPASVPRDASAMFSKNVLNFLKILSPKGEVVLNFEDDIVQGTCITHQGEVISPRLKTLMATS